MTNPVKEPKVRIQLDLTAKQAERFDGLMESCDLGSRKELFNVAMSLFYWATQEAAKGRKIASYDSKTDHVETIVVPALDAISLSLAGHNQPRAADNTASRTGRPTLGVVKEQGKVAASYS